MLHYDRELASLIRRVSKLEGQVLVMESRAQGGPLPVDLAMPEGPGHRFVVVRRDEGPGDVRLTLKWPRLIAVRTDGAVMAARVGLSVRLSEYRDSYEKDEFRLHALPIMDDQFAAKSHSQYHKSYDIGTMPTNTTWILEVNQSIVPTTFVGETPELVPSGAMR